MADARLIVASSLLVPSSPSTPHPKPSSSTPTCPFRRKPHPNPNPNPSPLLSDVRCDLTAPRHRDPAPTRRLLKYYARLASKLAQAGKLRDFLMIAESVLTSDAVADDCPQFVARINTKMVSAGIAAVLRNGGKLDEVLEFLREADRLGISAPSLCYGSSLEALAVECRRIVRRGKLEELVELMETLAGYGFFIKDISDPVHVLKIFVEKRRPEMAVRYASIFPHSQLLFNSIVDEFGKKQDMDSAIRAFEAFRQKSGAINMFAWRSIIDVCGLCGNFLESRRIFEELLAQNITPNIYFFNSLINVNAHDLSYTLHVYRHMQDRGVTADMATYNILLKACCNAKRVDLAQDIYKEIKHMASTGALKLDVITYSTMIKVFADAKMWKMSLNVKEDMLVAGVFPNVVTWSSLISACANAGLVDRAAQIFDEMLMAGCEPNAQCCNILLCACVKSCQYDRAFRSFYTWKENGFKIFHTTKGRGYGGSHISLTGKCSTENDSDQLVSCADDPQTSRVVSVVPFRPTVSTFNILMKACGTDHYHAKSLMEEMKAMGHYPNHISWSILIDIYGSSQNMRGAMEAFRCMRDAGIKLDVVAYTTAIKACVENKNLKIAFSLFEEMKRYRLQPNQVTYNTLLRARSKYGSLHEVQQCLTIYQDMRKAGYSSNDYYLKELIEEWCEGVICSGGQSIISTNKSYEIPDSKKPYSLLLEKVAMHLQKDVVDNQAIDIRGLTKVEARIVVLSVLWKVKESYRSGKVIKDDMIIISGAGKEMMGPANHELEVQFAIVKVLRDELGLDVVTGHGNAYGNPRPSSPDDIRNSAGSEKVELPEDFKYLARRPQDLGVLKITRKSLHSWLQKKGST